MLRLSLRFTLYLSLFFTLAACARPIQVNNFPELTFSHFQKIYLDVAEIKIVESYTSPLAPPHIEHETPVSLSKTARKWAENIFIADGMQGQATISISEASIIEEALKKNDGISGTFTTEQSERYTTKLIVSITAENGFGNKSSADTISGRSITVPEDISLVSREKVWFELIEKTTNDMGSKMSEQITTFMKQFLKR